MYRNGSYVSSSPGKTPLLSLGQQEASANAESQSTTTSSTPLVSAAVAEEKLTLSWVPTPTQLRRMVNGELSLGLTFWWYGLVIPTGLYLATIVLVAVTLEPLTLMLGWVAQLVFLACNALGVWRAAERHTGRATYATAAQMLAVLTVMYALVMCIVNSLNGSFVNEMLAVSHAAEVRAAEHGEL